MDVVNIVLASQPVKGSNIGHTIVDDHSFNGTPMAQDFFKYEHANHEPAQSLYEGYATCAKQ
jgi:hypothetical protein